jgi:hypothetical protein
MINPCECVRAILLANVPLVALVGDRIWCDQIPPDDVKNMPMRSLRIYCHGIEYSALVPSLAYEVRIMAFGNFPGYKEAWDVQRAVYDCLKRGGGEMIAVTGGNVYYYESDCLNPGDPINEPVVNWPRVDTEWLFFFNEDIV